MSPAGYRPVQTMCSYTGKYEDVMDRGDVGGSSSTPCHAARPNHSDLPMTIVSIPIDRETKKSRNIPGV